MGAGEGVVRGYDVAVGQMASASNESDWGRRVAELNW